MFSHKQIENNWKKIKSSILKKWDKLEEAEVEQTKGDVQSLCRLVYDKYGMGEHFHSEYRALCASCIHPDKDDTKSQTDRLPYRSPNMTDGWKTGQGMQTSNTNTASHENAEGQIDNVSANQAGQQGWEYQVDEVASQSDTTNPGRQVNVKETDEFKQSTQNIISDRSYSAPDEFFSIQRPSLTREDIPLGGNFSSAFNSSANNAAYNSFEDHSRNTKKL